MALDEFASLPGFSLELIRNPDNRGFCEANNQGIRASAASEFIALLNNDAEADPGWLAALLSAFDSAPEIGMAASKILVWEDPRRIDKVGHLIYPDGRTVAAARASTITASTKKLKRLSGRMVAPPCTGARC